MTEPKLTVYYDGTCPLCCAEIRHYRALDKAGEIEFVDASNVQADLGPGLTSEQALARFHTRDAQGRLASGASGFVALWAMLPKWRWVAWLAGAPGMVATLDWFYRKFLRVRPWLARRAKAFGLRPEDSA